MFNFNFHFAALFFFFFFFFASFEFCSVDSVPFSFPGALRVLFLATGDGDGDGAAALKTQAIGQQYSWESSCSETSCQVKASPW